MNINNELIAKAKEAASAEELLALAKENNVEITEDEAKEYYDRLHATGELSDDELENAAGGMVGGSCGNRYCMKCGGKNVMYNAHCGWFCHDCGLRI